tara:strand:+ start:746 stop:895 length:150 start_codon:yes stop_codon:yes gene_type:complete
MKKILISQSIMWAAAILVASIADEKKFILFTLIAFASVSLMNLQKQLKT